MQRGADGDAEKLLENHSLYADLLDEERPIKKIFEEEYGMRAEIHFCAPGEVSPALGDQYFPYFGTT